MAIAAIGIVIVSIIMFADLSGKTEERNQYKTELYSSVYVAKFDIVAVTESTVTVAVSEDTVLTAYRFDNDIDYGEIKIGDIGIVAYNYDYSHLELLSVIHFK